MLSPTSSGLLYIPAQCYSHCVDYLLPSLKRSATVLHTLLSDTDLRIEHLSDTDFICITETASEYPLGLRSVADYDTAQIVELDDIRKHLVASLVKLQIPYLLQYQDADDVFELFFTGYYVDAEYKTQFFNRTDLNSVLVDACNSECTVAAVNTLKSTMQLYSTESHMSSMVADAENQFKLFTDNVVKLSLEA